MPIYEYRCKQCGHQDSDMDSISAPRTKKCPQCGKRAFERLISASAFHLKGGGWYATDFKDKSPKTESAGDDKAVAAKDDSAVPDKDVKPGDKSAKSTDAKSAKSTDAKPAKAATSAADKTS